MRMKYFILIAFALIAINYSGNAEACGTASCSGYYCSYCGSFGECYNSPGTCSGGWCDAWHGYCDSSCSGWQCSNSWDCPQCSGKKKYQLIWCSSCRCSVSNPQCQKGYCGATCTSNADCSAGTACDLNTCSCVAAACGDCKTQYYGQNNALGIHDDGNCISGNNDQRFLCSGTSWYDCGWGSERWGTWSTLTSYGQIRWTGTEDWLCDDNWPVWKKGSAYKGQIFWTGAYDSVSFGGSWGYCDSRDNTGPGVPNGIDLSNNQIFKINAGNGDHDYICIDGSYESIAECCGDSLSNCYSGTTGDGIKLTTGIRPVTGSTYICTSAKTLINCVSTGVEKCDGIDNDCDGSIDEGCDNDGDRFCSSSLGYAKVSGANPPVCNLDPGNNGYGSDCNDGNAGINPSATEICGNTVDENCNGQLDENKVTYYLDSDGDNYINSTKTTSSCTVISGYKTTSGSGNDCDDNSALCTTDCTTMAYQDKDGDGYSNQTVSHRNCDKPAGYILARADGKWDCNDNNLNVNPSKTEICNGIDDNCVGGIDEGVKISFYRDADGDTYVNPADSVQQCTAPAGYISSPAGNDCDDGVASCTTDCSSVKYKDGDSDGYPIQSDSKRACDAPAGYISARADGKWDCVDSNNLINPAALEKECDGYDNDCNAATLDDPNSNCANILRPCKDLGGVESDKTIFTCSQTIPAQMSDPENPNLECCTGTLTSVGFEAFWSRQTSGYVKLLGAEEGEYIYCVVKGASGTVNINVDKAGTLLSAPNSPVTNGIAKYNVIADKIGTYTCTATYGAQTNSSSIKVTESGLSASALPFFGTIQFIIALFMIIIYCSVKRK